VFAHATEDADRVLVAARNMLPTEYAEAVNFKKSQLYGHYGNSIVLFEAKIKEKKVAQAVFQKLCSGLSVLNKEVLNDEIKQHVEKGNLYLRLDKQSAFLGEFKLGSVDTVHLRVHFRKHRFQDVVDICRKFGLLP
jgi:RNA binding exosome subunit